ncbi:MAG: hypothetical protein EOO11_17525 [Chitinophagaceae bacterium]|nr:MAG: hypothetical protein EOO11_17525 [Chitinophagaceae bacterium]
MSTIDLTRFNERIIDASEEMIQEIKKEAGAEGIVHRKSSPSKGSSVQKIKAKTHVDAGAIDRVSVGMRRSLVYTHKGAGKGRGGVKGSNWLDKYNTPHQTAEASKGKMGTGGRTAKPFINTALDSEKGVPNIANIAAEELGDAIVNHIHVK